MRAATAAIFPLSVGVELDVTPFINPDGLVVMDINQEIDDVNGYTAIDGNQVPNTDKRTLSSEIAVRIRTPSCSAGSSVPTNPPPVRGCRCWRTSPFWGPCSAITRTARTGRKLIVLMRPTVMKTLDASAAMTLKEERRAARGFRRRRRRRRG